MCQGHKLAPLIRPFVWACQVGKSGHGAPHCVFDMPKEVKDKILKVSTVKSAKTEEVFYFDDHLDLATFTTSYTPPLSSLQTLHTDPIESIIEPTIHTAHAIFTDTPDTPTSSCSTCKSRSRSRSPTLRGGRRRSKSPSHFKMPQWAIDHPELLDQGW